ncbi:hypothetical protein JCM6882_005124 [Rhodosporidiobolus microsporus]
MPAFSRTSTTSSSSSSSSALIFKTRTRLAHFLTPCAAVVRSNNLTTQDVHRIMREMKELSAQRKEVEGLVEGLPAYSSEKLSDAVSSSSYSSSSTELPPPPYSRP